MISLHIESDLEKLLYICILCPIKSTIKISVELTWSCLYIVYKAGKARKPLTHSSVLFTAG